MVRSAIRYVRMRIVRYDLKFMICMDISLSKFKVYVQHNGIILRDASPCFLWLQILSKISTMQDVLTIQSAN